ncbi:MAG TPA: B12-binding domain-containing radical SAM protein [Clostridiales bacterium]|nr:B12-binding domain-containing radical SAM protein [Clostridiales bacterium]
MKILLVALNAKYIHSNLAVYSLMAFANKYRDSISLVELTINHSEEELLKEIYKEKADVVAFSCYIWNIGIILRISSELKKVAPGLKIWFGGPEVSYDARQCLLENDQLDGIMCGEGEQTFLELVQYYTEGRGGAKPPVRRLKEIPGLAFKESAKLDGGFGERRGEIWITQPRDPMGLDEISLPYEDMEAFRNRIIYYESSRGCPFSCSYCLSSVDKRVRFRSIDLVKKELKIFLDYRVPQVKFVDRTFNCSKRHAMDIWEFIKENDNGITNFHFEIAADLLEEDEIAFLSTLRPGQVQFEIGVQSTNPDTVEAIRRKMDFDRVAYNVRRIKQAGNIHQHLDLIAGLPLEGYESFEKSFGQVYGLEPDQLQLGFLKVLKGSPMETDKDCYGIVFRSTPPYEVLCTNHLSFEEVLRLKGVCEMVEIYYNSGQFTYSMKFLEHFYGAPMRLYQSLGDYYEGTGIAMLAHNRIKRYEILLDFWKEAVLESLTGEDRTSLTEVFGEILLLDLYLRENIKSRPAFSPAKSSTNELRGLYDKYRARHSLIHIEKFTFDILRSAATGTAVRKETTILFDYGNRDMLSRAADMTVLED